MPRKRLLTAHDWDLGLDSDSESIEDTEGEELGEDSKKSEPVMMGTRRKKSVSLRAVIMPWGLMASLI